ncbi:MAG TPA: pirin family protein [Stellaceae bacterium]|nr:pirin family protein [Stellaceae bacterium]
MLDDTLTIRPVAKVVRGMPASDGAGVKLHRVIGTPTVPDVDPFLLLDEFRSDEGADYAAGFPDHPHRGFETVTYVLAGRMRHGDNRGNSGLLTAGSVQWMTAGRGIVHSEMPEQENGLMWGFQLWVNLPAKDKMIAPRYQDIAPDRIPKAALAGGVRAKVLAGSFAGLTGPVEGIVTEPMLLDLALPAGASVAVPVPLRHSVFAYVFEGEVALGRPGKSVPRGSAAVLGPGETVALMGGAAAGGRVLLAAAKPLEEPVARYGPFVMSTDAEIRTAIADFRAGRF